MLESSLSVRSCYTANRHSRGFSSMVAALSQMLIVWTNYSKIGIFSSFPRPNESKIKGTYVRWCCPNCNFAHFICNAHIYYVPHKSDRWQHDVGLRCSVTKPLWNVNPKKNLGILNILNLGRVRWLGKFHIKAKPNMLERSVKHWRPVSVHQWCPLLDYFPVVRKPCELARSAQKVK